MNNFKFRDKQGRARLTLSLFLELTSYDISSVLYTLKPFDVEVDGRVIPSIHRLYLECNDPTEYEFATKYFESWEHWEIIQTSNKLKDHIEMWRRDLAQKLKRDALEKIKEIAEDPLDKNYYQANKFLVEEGWNKKNTKKEETFKEKRQVGRPRKETQEDLLSEIDKEKLDQAINRLIN